MEIRIDQILLQALNFGILLAVLTKFLYKPILKILEQRADKVTAGLTAAQKNIDELAKIQETKKQAQKQADGDAQKIIEAAKVDAEKLAKEIIAKAHTDASQVMAKEEAAFKVRLEAQEKALLEQTTSLVLKLTKAVLKDTLSATAQQEIMEHQVKSLKKMSLN